MNVLQVARSARLIAIVSVLLLNGFATAADAASQKTRVWRTDFQMAWKQAKRQNRPLVIHFFADWCGPCRQMERVLNSDPLLRKLDASFVAVKVDTDRHPELVRRFRVQALPSDVFLSPEGDVVSRTQGYQARNHYLARMAYVRRQVPAPKREADPTHKAAGPHPNSVERQTNVGESQGQTDDEQRRQTGGGRAVVRREPQARQKGSANERRETAVARDNEERTALEHAVGDPGQTKINTKRDEAAAKASQGSDANRAAQNASPVVGLNGYSPVSLWHTRSWREGKPEFADEYQGVTYYMATAEELERFKQHPRRYAPRLLGCDPVILYRSDRAVSGSTDFCAYFEDELFVFSNRETRNTFRQNPRKYVRFRHVLRADEVRWR